MSADGSRNRSSIQSLISSATRPSASARSRCRAVILLSARKLTAPAGISSISSPHRNAAETSSARASLSSVLGAGT